MKNKRSIILLVVSLLAVGIFAVLASGVKIDFIENYGTNFRKNVKKLFTFPLLSCIFDCEQSRRPRVKCHRDGEFARRTKECSTMGSPHPLLHMG